MNNTERRIVVAPELRVEPRDENNQPVIKGYAAVFNSLSESLGDFQEKIRPGAFRNVLGDDCRALIDHEPCKILGRTTAGTLSLYEDERGLYCEITPPDTSYANDLLVSLRRGDITQMSFGFIVGEQDWEKEGKTTVRTINTVQRLLDVSCVTYPAYPDTEVAVRSLENWQHELDEEFARKVQRALQRAKRMVMVMDM